MMDKKVIFVIHPHSIVDVITNSSTELFCGVFSKNKFEDIKLYLEEVLGEELEILADDESGNIVNYIGFSIEYGDNEQITSEFIKILSKLLENTFGKHNFEIRTNVGY